MSTIAENVVIQGKNRISQRFNLSGQKFHKLTVIRFYDIYKKSRRWECICDCGRTALVPAGELIAGRRISCGCERFTLGKNTKFKYDSKQAFTNTKANVLNQTDFLAQVKKIYEKRIVSTDG